ncbi:MAG TPA: TetR family transcriptional regulator [Steroidobacteraceae bacterium]|nr:TetR family transcriptional regulator [Steroidobacteraceae bacterium]
MKKGTPQRPAKERILDAGERLFAERGYYGVSLRDITQSAGVDVALVSYHFGSKRDLFAAVFHRRAEILNRERLERLEAIYRAAGSGLPSIEPIVAAFIDPLLERSAHGGPGWKSYFALVAQVNNSPEWASILMTEHFDPLVQRFIAALQEAMPECPPREIYWGYQFLTGALTLTFAETGRIDKLSAGLCRSSDLESVHKRLAAFVAAGFRELCDRAAARPDPGQRRRSKTAR